MLNATRIVGERSYGHRFSSGPIEIADAAGYADALRAAHVEPDSEERRRQIVGGLDGLGGWSGPARRPGRGRLPRRVARRPRLQLRRALPAAAEPRRRDDDPAAHPRLPARREPVRVRRERRRSGDRARAGSRTSSEGRLEDASFTFERDVKVGIDAPRGAARRDHVLPRAPARSRTRPERLVKLVEALGGGEAALEAARLAKADQASELVREFPELEGHVGRRVRPARRLPGGRLAPRSTSSTCPTRPTRRCRRPRPAACSRRRTGSTRSTSRFALGQRPTGSRDPYGLRRAAIGLGRLATEGNLSIPRALMDQEVARVRRGALRGPARGAGRVRARRAPGSGARPRRRCPARGGARGAPGRAARPDPHRVHAREPARREGGGRCRGARARAARRGRGGRASPRRSSASTRRSRPRSSAGDFRAAVEARRRARPAPRPVLRGRARPGRRPSRARKPSAPPAERARHARPPRRALADPPIATVRGNSRTPTRVRHAGNGRECRYTREALRRLAASGQRVAARFRGRPAAVVSTAELLGERRSRRRASTYRPQRASGPARRYAEAMARAGGRAARGLRLDGRDGDAPRPRARGAVPRAAVRGDPASDGRERRRPRAGRATRAKGRPAVVVYTLVEPELRAEMRTLCRRARLHYCDLLGQPIEAVAKVSGTAAQDAARRAAPARRDVLPPHGGDRVRGQVRRRDRRRARATRTSCSSVSREPRRRRSRSTSATSATGRRTSRSSRGSTRRRSCSRSSRAKVVGLKIDAKRLAEIRKDRSRRMGGSNHRYSKLLEIYEELEQRGRGPAAARLPGDRHDRALDRGDRRARDPPRRAAQAEVTLIPGVARVIPSRAQTPGFVWPKGGLPRARAPGGRVLLFGVVALGIVVATLAHHRAQQAAVGAHTSGSAIRSASCGSRRRCLERVGLSADVHVQSLE